ncbi:L-aspartate oxidase [Sediminicurvatus halobius]|uniref:L-aspartate oxidase n=1 Tax=Sediminicurvatus halobius TaxID=2182432 RepID=A0A2U2MXS4_9GAMM|nr:L-aspartate oxidase [Spiribacter halobius]PWG61821.1 L-aspartate oxidase [Spiribacter halobius]UEX77661.1 L-aspartate oxidase [Spiribacter halobius]
MSSNHDRVIIAGSGLAGLSAALRLAPVPVLLITSGRLGRSGSTCWAQGGIACAMDDGDNPEGHAADTVAAGAGLSDDRVAKRVAHEAQRCIGWLWDSGVRFDLADDGRPALTREGAHQHSRILHAGGDQTGAELMRTLEAQVRTTPGITVMEDTQVVDLLVDDSGARGVVAQRGTSIFPVSARAVVLATGGAAALYASTTNPPGNWGSGLRLALRAGALLRDLEFVQFHPTALDLPGNANTGRPLPLASEAIRGEGGVLVDEAGTPVMAGVPGGDLAPRDVVARTLSRQREQGRRIFLDTRDSLGRQFLQRFPGVAGLCQAAGIDPVNQPIPVRPAAHYHMGGVQTDDHGATNVPGLWAIGEVASTGLHGANRLASNSLLEALAYAGWAAEDIRSRTGLARGTPLPPTPEHSAQLVTRSAMTGSSVLRLRHLMDTHVGVIRDRHGLEQVQAQFRALRETAEANGALAAMSEVAALIAQAALTRQESRGAHQRQEFNAPSPAWDRHQVIGKGTATAQANDSLRNESPVA